MSKVLSMYLVMIAAIGFVLTAFAENQTKFQSFLDQAAEGQQIEISVGQYAAQHAVNDRVKEFAQNLVDDHKKGSQQLEQLAMKRGVQLSPGLSPEHRQQVNALSQLSGHAFDRAYIDFILEDHEFTVEAFQRYTRDIQDQDIKQWIIMIVPILQDHRDKARQVKYTLQTTP